jgi:large subunit ribosomal protein L10
VVAAKGLRDFAKANPLLVIKGGVLDGKALGSDEISKLADLESREVLLAKLAGAMKAAPQQAVSLFAAPLSQAARLFAALQDKLQAEGGAVQDAAPADAPAEASTEETAPADS